MTAHGKLRVARSIAAAGVGATLFGTLLPWLRSGERARSSYQLAGLVGRVIDGTTATVAHAWLVYPLVAACAVAALVLHSGRLAVVAAALVASIAAAFALAVAQAPMPGLVGLWVTCLGAVITLVSLSFLIPTGSHLSAAVTLEQSRHGSLRIRP